MFYAGKIKFLMALTLLAPFCTMGASHKNKPDTAAIIRAAAPDMPAAVAGEAAEAMRCARWAGHGGNATKVAIIDYTKPSNQKRFWLIDLKKRKVLAKDYVAHGQGSGENIFAKKFSNKYGSHATSLGLFVTGSTYNGANGISLTMYGLNRGLNDGAKNRAIVMHGADYMNPSAGRFGRSWGCPALPRKNAEKIIKAVEGGNFIYAFGPGSGEAASCRWPSGKNR